MDTTDLPMRKHGKNALFFDVGGTQSDPNVISEQLQVLQRHSDLTPFSSLVFLIWPDAPVSEVLHDLVESFECFSTKGYSFRRLIFHEYETQDDSHVAVLQAACRHRLFRFLAVSSCVGDPANEATLYALKDGMTMNEDLVEMDLYLEVAGASFGILGDGLSATKSLETLSIGFGSREQNSTFQPTSDFLQGLKGNQTLQSLTLRSLPTEAWTNQILESLLDQPTLKSLSLIKSSWGNSSVEALGSLLSSPQCNISTLNLSDPSLVNREVLVENLANVFRNNQSIELLGLRSFGLDDAALSKLWSELSAMKRLISVDVSCNEIKSLMFIKSKVARLKHLDLWENPVLQLEASQADTRSGLYEFLQLHPELQSLGKDFAKSSCYSPTLQHLLDLNANGRILFSNGGDWAHSSIWPSVLERANRNLQEYPVRQASVVYGLVRDLSARL